MKKFSVVLFLFLVNPCLNGMSLAKVEEAVEEKVALELSDDNSVDIPLHQARLFGAFQNLLEHSTVRQGAKKTFPVSAIEPNILSHIVAQLESVHSITINDNTEESLNTINAELQKLDSNTLTKMLNAVDFLEIPILLDAILQEAIIRAPNTIVSENIGSLQSRFRKELIKNQILSLLANGQGRNRVQPQLLRARVHALKK